MSRARGAIATSFFTMDNTASWMPKPAKHGNDERKRRHKEAKNRLHSRSVNGNSAGKPSEKICRSFLETGVCEWSKTGKVCKFLHPINPDRDVESGLPNECQDVVKPKLCVYRMYLIDLPMAISTLYRVRQIVYTWLIWAFGETSLAKKFTGFGTEEKFSPLSATEDFIPYNLGYRYYQEVELDSDILQRLLLETTAKYSENSALVLDSQAARSKLVESHDERFYYSMVCAQYRQLTHARAAFYGQGMGGVLKLNRYSPSVRDQLVWLIMVFSELMMVIPSAILILCRIIYSFLYEMGIVCLSMQSTLVFTQRNSRTGGEMDTVELTEHTSDPALSTRPSHFAPAHITFKELCHDFFTTKLVLPVFTICNTSGLRRILMLLLVISPVSALVLYLTLTHLI